ncbi:MAG: sugar ABC transporter substrate-binding protein [Lachnospiraceae bacterium]
MKKKLLGLLLVATMTVSLLTGCGSGSSDTSGEKGGADGSGLIGVCMQNMSSSISELEAEALKETFEQQGYEVSVQDAGDDVSRQVSQVQNFILQGADMIVVLPCEIETLEDSLIEAREAGIKVVISGGTGSISEDAYDAVSADDEYVIGMWVASITKTWVEENLDPNGDWTVQFINSTISEDAIERCTGEFQIIEPYLKNYAGEYVNELWEVVDESEKIENPVYCEAVAKRVEASGGLTAVTTESDISGDNRSVVASVMTEDPNARVFISYNSLVSTAGSTYVLDTYPDQAEEFAFFSAGVMGDEYEYLVGATGEGAGTESVFRGACQFGGGDAAATLAALADAVLNGEEGVDYGKSNPNSIGLFYPIAAETNNGVAELVFFDSPTVMTAYTYADIIALNPKVYWDSVNGYNESAAPADLAGAGAPADMPAAPEGATVYVYENQGAMGPETLEFDLYEDGTCRFFLPGNAMITDVYAGTYTMEGTTVTITGLKNVDTTSSYTTPGLWGFIDAVSGDAVIEIDEAAGTFTPAE